MRYLIIIFLISSQLFAFEKFLFKENIKFNEGDLYFKNFETCKLDNKEIINKCRIGYRIWGKLNSDASNIIVFPTWHNGTTESLYKYGYIGSDGIVDSDDYLVIAIESFGNGISSSPSNSEDFPEFSIKDIVTFQYRLLKEEFNIDNVHAIVGVSMGGHITYEWMTEYPDFASKFLPIEGAPWHTNYDMLLYVARENALNGDFSKDSEILKATKTITALDGLMLWTPDYVEREYGNLGFDDWFNTLQKRGNTRDYLVNRKSQNDALISHDIRQDGVLTQDQINLFKDLDIFSIIFTSDLMVLPQPNISFAKSVGFDVLSIDGDCGHMGPEIECYQDQVKKAVEKFLSN